MGSLEDRLLCFFDSSVALNQHSRRRKSIKGEGLGKYV